MTTTPDLKAAALAATLDIEQERKEFRAVMGKIDFVDQSHLADINYVAHYYREYEVWLAAKRSMAARLQAAEDAAKAMDATIAEVIGCFEAANSEGLQPAIYETADERLKDLFNRRIHYAYLAAIAARRTT